MEWYKACTGASAVLNRGYDSIPPLNPFPIGEVQIDPGLPSLNVTGYLPQLPEKPALPDGQIPRQVELVLAFLDLTDLSLSGVPDGAGDLQIVKASDTETRFNYESNSFRFKGTCSHVAICSVRVLAIVDPNFREPRGPRLFSHYNVYNSCLLLLQQSGYTLRVSGNPVLGSYHSHLRWHAKSRDGAELIGDSPIELLGLAALHGYHQPDVNEPYWWRISGPAVVTSLIEEWEKKIRTFQGLDASSAD